jgi:uncharacterized membrane protein YccC
MPLGARIAPTAHPKANGNAARSPSALQLTIRYGLRITLSALAAFALVQFVKVPLHGLWAVLTAVMVTQASAGGSIRASLEYLLGTLAGAVYATFVALLMPHDTPLFMGAALALAIAPLAYAAASSPVFRVAPFTAVIVLLLGREFGESPLAAAATRLIEVALGGGVAVVVSLLVLPEGAHGRGQQAAAMALERLADALPVLLAGLSRRADPAEVLRVQDALGAAVVAFDVAVADAKHEDALSFAARSDPAPLSRTMLRLRHDLVIVGRAAVEPLPPTIAPRLAPLAAAFGSGVGGYLAGCARALRTGQPPPPAAQVDSGIDAYMAQVTAMRDEGLTRALSTSQMEQLFALGFAFDQILQNLTDLERCIGEWAAV